MKMMMLIDDAMLDAMLDMHPHCCVELRARAMAGARRCRPPAPAAARGPDGRRWRGRSRCRTRHAADGRRRDDGRPRATATRRATYEVRAVCRRATTLD